MALDIHGIPLLQEMNEYQIQEISRQCVKEMNVRSPHRQDLLHIHRSTLRMESYLITRVVERIYADYATFEETACIVPYKNSLKITLRMPPTIKFNVPELSDRVIIKALQFDKKNSVYFAFSGIKLKKEIPDFIKKS